MESGWLLCDFLTQVTQLKATDATSFHLRFLYIKCHLKQIKRSTIFVTLQPGQPWRATGGRCSTGHGLHMPWCNPHTETQKLLHNPQLEVHMQMLKPTSSSRQTSASDVSGSRLMAGSTHWCAWTCRLLCTMVNPERTSAGGQKKYLNLWKISNAVDGIFYN